MKVTGNLRAEPWTEVSTSVEYLISGIRRAAIFSAHCLTILMFAAAPVHADTVGSSILMTDQALHSLGIDQVDRCVSDMDRATQQNSALVEALAEMSSMLNKRTRNLASTARLFELPRSLEYARETVLQPESTCGKAGVRRC